jgi:hypothetical protein
LVTFEQLLAVLVGQCVLHPVVGPPHQLVEVLVRRLDRLVGGLGQAGARLGVVVLDKEKLDEQINIKGENINGGHTHAWSLKVCEVNVISLPRDGDTQYASCS